MEPCQAEQSLAAFLSNPVDARLKSIVVANNHVARIAGKFLAGLLIYQVEVVEDAPGVSSGELAVIVTSYIVNYVISICENPLSREYAQDTLQHPLP